MGVMSCTTHELMKVEVDRPAGLLLSLDFARIICVPRSCVRHEPSW